MYLKDFDFDGIINDHMVIPKFMNNKINTLGQDIQYNKFLGNLVKYCFL